MAKVRVLVEEQREAIQWDGSDSTYREIRDLVDCGRGDGGVLRVLVTEGGYADVRLDYWVVDEPDGYVDILSPRAFARRYLPVEPQPPREHAKWLKAAGEQLYRVYNFRYPNLVPPMNVAIAIRADGQAFIATHRFPGKPYNRKIAYVAAVGKALRRMVKHSGSPEHDLTGLGSFAVDLSSQSSSDVMHWCRTVADDVVLGYARQVLVRALRQAGESEEFAEQSADAVIRLARRRLGRLSPLGPDDGQAAP